MSDNRSHALSELRQHIERIEGLHLTDRGILSFGIEEIDSHLPGGGLALGALHEIAGGGSGLVDSAAASLFASGIAARTKGPILWLRTRADLFAPALDNSGLTPDRVIYFDAGDEKSLLVAFEECLSYGGIGAVVAEVAKLGMTPSKRLQLAAERTGTMAIAVRRWRRENEAVDFGQPTTAMTRWRVSELNSERLPVAGVGRPRWQLELLRCRAGESAKFIVEACDEKGFIASSSHLAHRSVQAEDGRRRAFAN